MCESPREVVTIFRVVRCPLARTASAGQASGVNMRRLIVKPQPTLVMSGPVRDRFSIIERHVRTGSVLDVGCVDSRPKREPEHERLGRLSDSLFRRICEVNPEALGVDTSAEGIEILRQQGCNVLCADAVSMTLGRKFDVIVAGEVVEHVENVGLFLSNLAGHLAGGGVLIVSTPNPFYSGQIARIWRRGRPRVHEDHTGWFDPITLQAAMERAGLEPFEGYWVQPKRSPARTWRVLFRRYFSHSFMILARLGAGRA